MFSRRTLLALAGLLLVGGAPVRAAPMEVVMLGDSITAGYGLPAAEALPVRLEAALKAKGLDVTITNAGVSGDTTGDGLARVDWSVGPGAKAVIVALGGNDALRGLPPAETRRNLAEIVARLKARGVKVLVAGMMAPRNLGADYAASFDPVFPDVARGAGVAFYPFLLDGVAADPALNQRDGIHPNLKGVAVIVEKMAGPVADWLKAAP